MRALTPLDTLRLWEHAHALRPPERALALAAVAHPDVDEERLRAMSVGAGHASILHLRWHTLGATMACEARCPTCDEKLEFELSTADLLEGAPAVSIAVEVVRGETTFIFQPPTLGHLLDAQRQPDPESFLAGCCRVSPAEVDMPEDVIEEAEQKLAEADPLARVVLHLSCPACVAAWEEVFDVAGYVLREMGQQAQALLYDVHRLAARYGWTEADVLALSPWRRRQYLTWAEA